MHLKLTWITIFKARKSTRNSTVLVRFRQNCSNNSLRCSRIRCRCFSKVSLIIVLSLHPKAYNSLQILTLHNLQVIWDSNSLIR